MMQILVSGASSGLGKYLKEHFEADAFDREGDAPAKAYDAIIHCAFNTGRNIPHSAFPQYLEDNLGVAGRLLDVPHHSFVFISSVDVYPPGGGKRREDEDFPVDGGQNLYGIMKSVVEAQVNASAERPVILRPAAMLGPYIRKNSLLRILEEENPALTLSADSSFNYVRHEDIAALIAACLERKEEGIYNVASAANVTLSEICLSLGRKARFGNHRYITGDIDNAKASALVSAFKETSLETAARFAAARNPGKPETPRYLVRP